MVAIDEIAWNFQEYMTDRGYERIDPDSLVNETFPTCFTVSGGPNFVGRPGGPYVVVQPCHRYWDAGHVGDETHLSFFEMAVTFSDKPEDRARLMGDHLSFLQGMGLEPFTAHYFAGGVIAGKEMPPDDVRSLWESQGVVNFVAHTDIEAYVANKVEPYGGPRTELFHNENLEVFTSVLYNKKVENGRIVGENNPSTVAAGFGIERVVQATTGLISISDIFNPIDSNPIVSDHIRGLVFLLKDGAFELSGDLNSSRKTILNRYLRGFQDAFGELNEDRLRRLIGKTIRMYERRYAMLVGREDEFAEKIKERAKRLKLD